MARLSGHRRRETLYGMNKIRFIVTQLGKNPLNEIEYLKVEVEIKLEGDRWYTYGITDMPTQGFRTFMERMTAQVMIDYPELKENDGGVS